MAYLVTGFSDVFAKPAGSAGIVAFKEEHRFRCDVLPDREALIAYAEERGYRVGESRSSGMGIVHGERAAVAPIYEHVDGNPAPIGEMTGARVPLREVWEK